MNAINEVVASAFLRRLRGFRGYPSKEGGVRFVEVLCEVSVSVDHCEAIINSFEGEFPTIREIRDTAFALRPKFELAPNERAELEKKYGKPEPWKGDSRIFGSSLNPERSRCKQNLQLPLPGFEHLPRVLHLPKKDVKERENEMYAKLRVYPFKRKEPTWQEMAKAARELGYPEYANAWERSLV